MARYERTYDGERRTEGLRVQLTPTERAALEADAKDQGAANISTYARQLLFRRSAAVVAATRRNPEAKVLVDELRAIGINLNQLARHANTTGKISGRTDELRAALQDVKAATARVLAL